MKNYISLIFVSLFVFSSCTNTCKITATLPDDSNDGKMVFLQELSLNGQDIINLDSTTIKGNTFRFDVKADSLNVRFLTIDDLQGDLTNMALVFIEKGDVSVQFDTINVVSGTPLNERYRTFLREDRASDMQASDYYQILEDKARLRFNFVKEIIDQPAGEFFFLSFLATMEPNQALELIKLSRPEFQQREEIRNIKTQAEHMINEMSHFE